MKKLKIKALLALFFVFVLSTGMISKNGVLHTYQTGVDPVSMRDFYIQVAAGNVPGYSAINKFGYNSDIDTGSTPEDVWDYGGVYTFSTTADIDQLSSSDNGDTQLVTLIGLDANWDEVSQTKTLTGQTPVTLDTPLLRIYRMYNSGSSDFSGNIYVSTNGAALTAGVPDVATTVRAMVTNGNNQTLMCIYTIPAGHSAFFISGYVAYAKSSSTGAILEWRARPNGGVFQIKSIISLLGQGSSTWSYHYGIPPMLPEKTDIKITCSDVEANNTGVSGGFDMILIDNDYL